MGCPLCWWWLQSDFGFIRLCLSVLPHHSSLFDPFICLGTVVVGCSNTRPYYCSCLTFYLETMSCPQSPPTCSHSLMESWHFWHPQHANPCYFFWYWNRFTCIFSHHFLSSCNFDFYFQLYKLGFYFFFMCQLGLLSIC